MPPKKKKIKKRFQRRYILLVIVIAYITYAFGSEYFTLTKLNSQYANLDGQKQALLVQQKYLQAQQKYMNSNAFIEMTARKELGLIKTGEHLVLSAKPGDIKILEKKPQAEEIKD